MDENIRLYYKGEAFENTMSIHDMHKVIEGLKEMMDVVHGPDNYEFYIREIKPGSCDIKGLLKDYGVQVGATLTAVALQAILFTGGKEFTYQINGDNNQVTINNFSGDSTTYNNGAQLPRILESSKFREAGKKITGPIQGINDSLSISLPEKPDEVMFTPANKCVFYETNKTISQEVIRGRMYEINLEGPSFKVHLPSQERKFTVYISSSSQKSIYDFLPFVGTSDLNLIGVSTRNMEGEITKFHVSNFEVIQASIAIPE